MSDTNTVQRKVRPITIKCGASGCSTKPLDAVLEEHADGTREVIAPKGWAFAKNPHTAGDAFVGTCPVHWVDSAKK
ncbi:MAG: hypothetical protein ACLQVI_35515 [Polyangiaceae bacterium]|jgi:hypothetical protein